MNRTRTLAPLLGLTALAATTFTAAPARAQTTYTVTDLAPAGQPSTQATGVSGKTQVGIGSNPATLDGTYRALLWTGTAASAVNLHPAGFEESEAHGVSGNSQVGFGYNYKDVGGDGNPFIEYENFHALLWHGTAASVVDLNPDNFDETYALGVSGNAQVGYGLPSTGNQFHALLWHGTAASVVDLQPAGFTSSQANGVSGSTQVGNGYFPDTDNGGSISHALLWTGTTGSVVDLHPFQYTFSFANGVDGDTQVGTAILGDSEFVTRYAFLWHGTAASAVNLTPGNDEDVNNFAEALAVSGPVQVGDGDINGVKHALAWHGTANSTVDLNDFLPTGYNSQSVATGVNSSGDIVGYGSGSSGQHAFVWHPASAGALAITSLDPASRTAGRGDFTLTVIGTGFTAASKVQWNGVSQTTTFVSSTKLTAPISRFLIADQDSARITVLTSNTALSNTRLETIMSRPIVTSLSPKSKKAGSAAFTLTVTGTGFRPASFYAPSVVKWNGAELATTFVSTTKLTAQVPVSLIAHSGMATVTVTTPQVATTTGKAFTVTP